MFEVCFCLKDPSGSFVIQQDLQGRQDNIDNMT